MVGSWSLTPLAIVAFSLPEVLGDLYGETHLDVVGCLLLLQEGWGESWLVVVMLFVAVLSSCWELEAADEVWIPAVLVLETLEDDETDVEGEAARSERRSLRVETWERW